MSTTKALQSPSSTLERAAYSIAEFCFRNDISRSAYQRLPQKPAEMRIGLNLVRISAEAERDWQRLMQAPNPALEQQALERAVKAGTAAAKSSKHVSKTRRSRQAMPGRQRVVQP